MHAYMHAYLHAYIYACMRYTCTHARMHAYMHACAHAYMHACIYAEKINTFSGQLLNLSASRFESLEAIMRSSLVRANQQVRYHRIESNRDRSGIKSIATKSDSTKPD